MHLMRRTWVPVILAVVATASRPVSAQPAASNDRPITYEVQIDGESFLVEGGQRPVKVDSKLKKGTSYKLAVRVAMTQLLRLNSVQLEYGMWAEVTDTRRNDLRIAQIRHELGFSLEITDLGHVLDEEHRNELLKTVVDDLEKRLTDRKASGLKRTEPKVQKFGSSDSKRVSISFTDSKGVARSCAVFVLSGERYTVSAVSEFRDQDKEDVGPWVTNALESIRPLQ
jgi:hypothetical protein